MSLRKLPAADPKFVALPQGPPTPAPGSSPAQPGSNPGGWPFSGNVLAGVVGVVLPLALLTWLLLRGIDANAAGYAEPLRSLGDFALADASLDCDVLGCVRPFRPRRRAGSV